MRKPPSVLWASCWVAAAVAAGFPLSAKGQSLERLSNQVESTDIKKAVAAARALGKMRSAQALDVLMETLLLGARPELGLELVKAVGHHASPKAFHLLAHFARHRDERIRAEAIRAVAQIKSLKLAEKTFDLATRALRDGSSAVRAEGARLVAGLKGAGLGRKHLARAEKLLLHLLLVRKDQRSARIALSVIGTVRTARFLAVHLDVLPERIVTTLCASFLKRPDFGPEPVRVWVVRTLGRLSGPEAIAGLMEYIRDAENKATLSVALAKSIAEK